MSNKAILLANLGSPDSPDTSAVRRYLNEFLMDPYVIQLPWLFRRLIVSLFVLPKRPKASARAYQSVWLSEGSPLIVLSQQLQSALQTKVKHPVALAMRYGKPSIESQILNLAKDKDLTEIIFIPLYPHYAESTVETSIAKAKQVIKKHGLNIKLSIVPPFYDHPDYIAALVDSIAPYLQQKHDHILFSYHGLPESHITKLDPSATHCLQQQDCCSQPSSAHKNCYKHHTFNTTQAVVNALNLSPSQYSSAFQSRLGRAKWLAPNTEDRLRELAENGVKNLLVVCPSFVTDCLETLEEIQLRANAVFLEAGGESLTLLPCLNNNVKWIDTLASWCHTDPHTHT